MVSEEEVGKTRPGYPWLGQAVTRAMASLCAAAVETTMSYCPRGADVPDVDKYICMGLGE